MKENNLEIFTAYACAGQELNETGINQYSENNYNSGQEKKHPAIRKICSKTLAEIMAPEKQLILPEMEEQEEAKKQAEPRRISRRTVITGAIVTATGIGVLGMTLIHGCPRSEQNPQNYSRIETPEEKRQRLRQEYFFTYEEWKKGIILKDSKYSKNIIEKAKKMYENPELAYSLLDDEEKLELSDTVKGIKRIEETILSQGKMYDEILSRVPNPERTGIANEIKIKIWLENLNYRTALIEGLSDIYGPEIRKYLDTPWDPSENEKVFIYWNCKYTKRKETEEEKKEK